MYVPSPLNPIPLVSKKEFFHWYGSTVVMLERFWFGGMASGEGE
jgi:hypothetical protein